MNKRKSAPGLSPFALEADGFITGVHGDPTRVVCRLVGMPHDQRLSMPMWERHASQEAQTIAAQGILSRHIPVVVIDDAIDNVESSICDMTTIQFASPPWDQFFIDGISRQAGRFGALVKRVPLTESMLAVVPPLREACGFGTSDFDAVLCHLWAASTDPNEPLLWCGNCMYLIRRADQSIHRFPNGSIHSLFGSRVSTDPDPDCELMRNYLARACLLTNAFLNASNIETVEVPARAALAQLRQRPSKRMAWITTRWLRLRLKGGQLVSLRPPSAAQSSGGGRPLTLVRGYFQHHTRHFGKFARTFWVPPHFRGTAELGIRLRNYELSSPVGI